jgi:transcriptional regulator with XRE-family HTH domain
MSKELADKLRDAIHESGLSANALADEAGVPQQTISRFLLGADMKLSTAQRLAAFLNLELVERKPKR